MSQHRAPAPEYGWTLFIALLALLGLASVAALILQLVAVS